MLDTVTVQTFAERIGESFRIDLGDDGTFELEVVEAQGIEAGSDRREPFSVLFRGAKEVVLGQRIYRLEHEAVGALDLFLVPIGPDEKGMRYEAVFT